MSFGDSRTGLRKKRSSTLSHGYASETVTPFVQITPYSAFLAVGSRRIKDFRLRREDRPSLRGPSVQMVVFTKSVVSRRS